MSTTDTDALFDPVEPTAPAAGETKARSSAPTKHLLAQLERHYIRPGTETQPGGIFVTEVGMNGGWGSGRRADAIYVGFTAASGRLMIGHELKASRSDWLHELDQHTKAAAWGEQCHEWWIVTLPGIVKLDELPAEWGLMEPPRRGRKMRVVKPAPRFSDRQPSWDVCRSVFARWDTLRAKEISDINQAASDRATEKINQYAERVRDNPAEQRAQETLLALQEALGDRYLQIHHDADGTGHRFGVSVDDLARIGTLLRSERDLRRYTESITRGFRGPLDEVRQITAGLQSALDALAAVKPAPDPAEAGEDAAAAPPES